MRWSDEMSELDGAMLLPVEVCRGCDEVAGSPGLSSPARDSCNWTEERAEWCTPRGMVDSSTERVASSGPTISVRGERARLVRNDTAPSGNRPVRSGATPDGRKADAAGRPAQKGCRDAWRSWGARGPGTSETTPERLICVTQVERSPPVEPCPA
jgi:hypothetical protein